jgi:hypothetical protein
LVSEFPVPSAGSLAPAALQLARRLGATVLHDDFYLAGSAALAIQLGHRPVSNLDFMSATHRLLPPGRRDLLEACLALDPEVRVETARDGYLFLRFATGTGVQLFYYPYPLAAPLVGVSSEDPAAAPAFDVASLADLGLMKLGAIISRGSKRDFVDLYLLCRQLPLGEIFAASADKFGHVLDFPLQAVKALADRSEWPQEPLPKGNAPLSEGEIIAWLDKEIAQWSRRILENP